MGEPGPSIRGVVETALHVTDLDRSERFYRRLFGSERLEGDKRMRALAAGPRQVLLLFLKGASTQAMEVDGGVIPPHDGAGRLHVAFAIDRADVDRWRERLQECGVPVESTVHWPRGGVSLYFRDPDEHLVELVTPGCWSIY